MDSTRCRSKYLSAGLCWALRRPAVPCQTLTLPLLLPRAIGCARSGALQSFVDSLSKVGTRLCLSPWHFPAREAMIRNGLAKRREKANPTLRTGQRSKPDLRELLLRASELRLCIEAQSHTTVLKRGVRTVAEGDTSDSLAIIFPLSCYATPSCGSHTGTEMCRIAVFPVPKAPMCALLPQRKFGIREPAIHPTTRNNHPMDTLPQPRLHHIIDNRPLSTVRLELQQMLPSPLTTLA
ncbi:hypothetical protein P154DRAFT_571613 [Amniculicola lignicola CBS 123094]|uniref:Uncharacterized protein n=1 Tax=Amniculicola lignicola CBS 123094 TaxID=1392246 RepID=A0A6A5WSM9_9PLEO|nr:hypothetical protein P154DRAFT_571613 [Amniculicola lignicola CBS 123094]